MFGLKNIYISEYKIAHLNKLKYLCVRTSNIKAGQFYYFYSLRVIFEQYCDNWFMMILININASKSM